MIGVLMSARTRYLRGESFDERQRVEGDCARAVPPVSPQPINHAPIG